MILLHVLRLPGSELLLLLNALRLVLWVRMLLWLFPYDRVRRHFTRDRAVSKSMASSALIVQFVEAVSRRIPRTTCLASALAAETLLRKHGYDACLRIGVSKGTGQGLLAHAWVESGGRIVIGAEQADGLTPLRSGAQLYP